MIARKQKSVSTVFNKSSLNKILNENTPFAIREAYCYFRTKLMFTGKGEICPVFVFTSGNAGEGKTLTTINSAITFAELRKKTLIIDGDMRNPSFDYYFNLRGAHGLSEYLAGIDESVSIHKAKTENLFVLTAGTLPPNPSELLASSRLQLLLEKIRAEYDYVFIDTPPAGIVSDALALAQHCTGYVIVSQCGATRLSELQAVIRVIEQVGGCVSGVVLNDSLGKGNGTYNSKNYRRRNAYYHRNDNSADEK